MAKNYSITLILCFLAFTWVGATENAKSGDKFYVDPVKGNDKASGAENEPFKTVAYALKLLDGKGGEIHLASEAVFRENIFINRQHGGRTDAPLIIEGNSAIINCGIDVTDGPWTKLDDGYRLERDVPEHKIRYGISVVFVNGLPLFHDHPNGKGRDAWHGGSVRYDENGRMIVVFPNGLEPNNSVIVLTGKNEGYSCVATNSAGHVTVRNLTAVFAGNDGFNFHGFGATDFRLENVTALFCGDEGISAHEDYQIEVQDSEVAFCGSHDGGIVDVNDSQSVYQNVRSHQNRNFGFKLVGTKHVLINCLSYGNPLGNLPKESDKISMIDCRDEGQVEEDKTVPVYSGQAAPALNEKVGESNRMARFLQYRPPKDQ